MKHLFKQYGVLTTEAARTQEDELFIGDVTSHISSLRSYVIDNGINETSKPENDVEFKKILDNISKTLTNRFGIQFKLVLSKHQMLGTHIVAPPEHNVLMGSLDEYYSFLGKHFKESKKPSEVVDINKDEESFYNTIYNNYKSLKNKLDTGNIIIDLKEARISNAPSNLVTFIYICPSKLLSEEYGLTDREVVAGLIHEVGHSFSAIENSYRHIINTSVILDSIHETIRVKNGSPLDAIKLSYKRLTNIELETKNIITAAVALKNKYRTIAMNNDDNFVLTTTDSESLADLFASRFLIGDDLASGLSKLGGTDRPYTEIELMHMSFKENLVINTILLIVLLPLLGILLPMFILIITMTSIGDLKTFSSSARVYDKFNRRLLKIKQDATRQLRLLKEAGNYNEQTIKKLVSIIDNVDKTIQLHKDNKSSITKFIEKFEFNKDSKNLISFSDTISSLMENDLYYISEKI